MSKADDVIKRLNLSPLPQEGGDFRCVKQFGNEAGMIYYLMTADAFSHLHSLTEDETWIFLEGDSIEQTTVSPDGVISKVVLGPANRISVVGKGCFQATRIAEVREGYALVSTVMSPRYNDEMYTHGASVPRIREIKELEDLL